MLAEPTREVGSEASPTRSMMRVEYVFGPHAKACLDERELLAVLAARMGYGPIAMDAGALGSD